MSSSSKALADWQSDRAQRIERLRAAHSAFLHTEAGHAFGAKEIEHSLILRLASEFQGFARDLHSEAVDAVLDWLCPDDPALRKVLRTPYLDSRRLDLGNADPKGIAHDFNLLGIAFWPELGARNATAQQWRGHLGALNTARNGLMHSDDGKINRLVSSGWPLGLRSAELWRASLDQLAGAMDDLVGARVGGLTGRRPR
jgi:hypothetical protein